MHKGKEYEEIKQKQDTKSQYIIKKSLYGLLETTFKRNI